MIERQTEDLEAAMAVLICAETLTNCLPYLFRAHRACLEATMEAATKAVNTGGDERLFQLIHEAGAEVSGVLQLVRDLSDRMTQSAARYATMSAMTARDQAGATQH